ncbi:hypothetical protein BKA56DRAFT_602021 [Ilyonectria sp. MPI-CAGE-AT-0026]|nr:hypothetical protein BKA56DRAFT_602021 [Ilyonectria sp. MPI-CAGE-AT-0026]
MLLVAPFSPPLFPESYPVSFLADLPPFHQIFFSDNVASTMNSCTKPVVEPTLLIDQLKLRLQDPESLADDAQRYELKQLCRRAAGALEAPFETAQRLAYSVRPLPR